MQRAVNNLAGGGVVESLRQPGGHLQRVGHTRRTVLTNDDVEGFRSDVVLRQVGGHALDAGRTRRGNRRVSKIDGNQLFELRDQLMYALGRQIQAEQFDSHEPVAIRLVRTEHRAQRTGTDLMKHAKWTEGIRGRRADSFRVQLKTPQGRRLIVTLYCCRFN